MKALILQHSPEENPGTLLDWLRARGLPHQVAHVYRDPLPAPEGFDWLVILGGTMNTDEEAQNPWMTAEKQLIRAWVREGKPVLGICLGGQLLAEALGGRVGRGNEREVGFHEVRLTGEKHPALRRWPARLEVYQYHGDVFSLPPGCVKLAESEGCPVQAYARDARTLGLQFHPESSAEWVRGNAESAGKEPAGRWVQPPMVTEEKLRTQLRPMTESFFALLDDFVAGWKS